MHKARFFCMETHLLFSLNGEKADDRKNAVGFRLRIRCLNGICKDITGLGRWENDDVELFMEHQDELDQLMGIVKQSFDAQAE